MAERLAVIDIGTNSILLLVADVSEVGDVHPVLDEARITRLGKGVDGSGRLSLAAMERSLAAVRELADMARNAGAERIVSAGTSALRDATNATDFLTPAQAITGAPVRVISGPQEAEYSWLSVASDPSLGLRFPAAMADVGGGSTELVSGDPAGVSFVRSVDMGAVRLTERCLLSDPYTPGEVARGRTDAAYALAGAIGGLKAASLVGIGGTIVNLACIASGKDHSSVHGLRVTRDQVSGIIEDLSSLPLGERRSVPGLEPLRADVIVGGAVIFEALMLGLGLDDTIVSIRGARFGMATAACQGVL